MTSKPTSKSTTSNLIAVALILTAFTNVASFNSNNAAFTSKNKIPSSGSRSPSPQSPVVTSSRTGRRPLRIVTGLKGKPANSKEDDMEMTIQIILDHEDKITAGDTSSSSNSSSSSSSSLISKISSLITGSSKKIEMDEPESEPESESKVELKAEELAVEVEVDVTEKQNGSVPELVTDIEDAPEEIVEEEAEEKEVKDEPKLEVKEKEETKVEPEAETELEIEEEEVQTETTTTSETTSKVEIEEEIIVIEDPGYKEVEEPIELESEIQIEATSDEEVVNGVDEEVVNGVDEEVVNGVDEEVVNGIDEEVVNGVDEEVVNGVDEEVVNGIDEEVVNGIDEEVVNGIDEEVVNGIDEEVANGIKVVVNRAEEVVNRVEEVVNGIEEEVVNGINGGVAVNGDATAVAIVGEESATTITSSKTDILSTLTSCFPLFVLSAALTGIKEPKLLSWVNQGATIPIMLGAVMTFMGMTLSTQDFTDVLSPSKDSDRKATSSSLSAVPIGVLCQFLIMPLTAYGIGSALLLPSHTAAFLGLLLVGCSPGGTASNLVSLIAKADVALSVILTTASTVLASVLTPVLVKTLLGSTIAISGKVLCKATAQVILGPIILGMGIRKILPNLADKFGEIAPFAGVVLVSLLCGGVVAQNASIFLAGGVNSALVKKITMSVLGLHSIGFAIGYLFPRKIFGLSKKTSRTISIETGMQNSALAVVLARSVVSAMDAPTTALMSLAMLPGAMSATAHSCLGSALAVYWRFRDARGSSDDANIKVTSTSASAIVVEEAPESTVEHGIEGVTVTEEYAGSGI
jgi:BASS family bile acid:Na+ symporter